MSDPGSESSVLGDPVSMLRVLARRSGAGIALRDGDRAFSFRDLDERSGAVAASLAQAGIAAGDPIGIAINPSFEMVASVLGILRSGCPYVPIDLRLPSRRVEAILADVQPAAVLVDEFSRDRIAKGWKIMEIDSLATAGASAPSADRDPGPDDLAYILYTSGSTGAPKGVAMRYGALVNLLRWQLSQKDLAAPARTLQLTPLSFDVSFQEIFTCLCSQGELLIPNAGVRSDPGQLITCLQEQRVQRIYMPFIALRQLAETANRMRLWPVDLVDVITAGEQLQATSDLIEFFGKLPGCALHNHYGPCETHVVTVHKLALETSSWPALPPIGRAIDGVEILLMDEDLQPVAKGQIGEIFISGDCLARGYLNQAERTAERFVHVQVGAGGEQRCYRTGDLGRELANGDLEWIGRNDQQVKVRGYRVELGEVETVLAEHPRVTQAVVMPRQRKGLTDLVAYVTTRGLEQDEVLASIGEWEEVWNQTYGESAAVSDPTFNTVGWNSSFDGQPIPAAEMRNWVAQITKRVLVHRPRRIMEVGCGTGLLLFELAPQCEQFVGLDFSQPALDYLHQHIGAAGLAEKVELRHCAAHDLQDFAGESFDAIVLNSVTQHFASAEYLREVIKGMVALAPPPGVVFIGDVTSLALREAFFASVELAQVDGEVGVGEFRQVLERRMRMDRELLIDPEFFVAVAATIPEVTRVEIQLKGGAAENELTTFRYDVTLHLAANSLPAKPSEELFWAELGEGERSLDALLPRVAAGAAVRGLPNTRVSGHCAFLARLREAEPESNLADCARELPGDNSGEDPEDWFEAARKTGLDLELRPSADPGEFDLLPALSSPSELDESRLLPGRHCSDPQRNQIAAQLLPDLRRHVAARLPEYMHPSAYVVMTAFPNLASGKVDRAALPAPDHSRPELAQEYQPPRSKTEKAMASAWREILALDRVGIHDRFFDLGGNSILVLELVQRISSDLDRDVQVVDVLEHATIASLARSFEGGEQGTVSSAQDRGEKQRRAMRNRRPRRPGSTRP